jgi:hypothetical protein
MLAYTGSTAQLPLRHRLLLGYCTYEAVLVGCWWSRKGVREQRLVSAGIARMRAL